MQRSGLKWTKTNQILGRTQLESPNMFPELPLSPSIQNSKQVDNSAGIRLSHKRVTSAARLFCRKISHPEFAMPPMD